MEDENMNTERKWQISTIVFAIALLSTFTLGQASSSETLNNMGQYEDGALYVDFDLLPGVRIRLTSPSDIRISTEETSHIWHGFRTDEDQPWSALTPFEQTEFLSTNAFRFFYKGNEVPLRYVTRYDPVDDSMWSIFYRVFPPGFFPKGMHQVHGEWSWLDNGVWGSFERSNKLDVYDPYEPVLTADQQVVMEVGAAMSFRNLLTENPPSDPTQTSTVFLGTDLWDPAQYDDIYVDLKPSEMVADYTNFWLQYTQGTLTLTVESLDEVQVYGLSYPIADATDWDVMQIVIGGPDTHPNAITLHDFGLNGYPLGALWSAGLRYWTVTGIDFENDWTLIGTLALDEPGIFPEDVVHIIIGTLTP
jgi:hypothetical protein